MKKDKIIYWTTTIIFAGFMLFTAIPDILNPTEVADFMTKLGYPPYFTPFIGWAKVLGAIVILIPRFPRLKEWAYAGMAFDLVGAAYSVYCAFGDLSGPAFILVIFLAGTASYIYHHKLLKQQ